MSQHHRKQKWTTHAPKLRKVIEAMLPRPCITCGRPVTRDQRWHVGHIRAAAMGGRPTVANTGPVHEACNLREGGRLGAAVTNGRRVQRERDKDIRPW